MGSCQPARGLHLTLVTMRTVAFAALVCSAAAFAPALSGVRTGATSLNMAMDKSGRAPVITVFDHRGCTAHKNTDYTGPKANGMEDEQCVKVQSVKIAGPDAETVLRDSLATLKKKAAGRNQSRRMRQLKLAGERSAALRQHSRRAPRS